jgi:hypothetical protein
VAAVALLPLLAAAVCAAGVTLYLQDRATRQVQTLVGEDTDGAQMEFEVTVQKVDTAAQELQLAVLPVPLGSLVAQDDPRAPRTAVKIETSSLTQPVIQLAADEPVSLRRVSLPLTGGTFTDYPFDRYHAQLSLLALVDGDAVPVVISLQDSDPFFETRVTGGTYRDGVLGIDTHSTRTLGTLILAWFMMAAMWAVALVVVGAAAMLVRRRQPLTWPALGWLAATLFALVGLRNAAPGGPPIGSLFDYAAFFWAEALVALSLVGAAASGIHHERRILRREQAERAGHEG